MFQLQPYPPFQEQGLQLCCCTGLQFSMILHPKLLQRSTVAITCTSSWWALFRVNMRTIQRRSTGDEFAGKKNCDPSHAAYVCIHTHQFTVISTFSENWQFAILQCFTLILIMRLSNQECACHDCRTISELLLRFMVTNLPLDVPRPCPFLQVGLIKSRCDPLSLHPPSPPLTSTVLQYIATDNSISSHSATMCECIYVEGVFLPS